MQKIPLVTVTCCRDLALLELQAQSIYKHLTPGHDVYLVVNEADPSEWHSTFDNRIAPYYEYQNLHVFHRSDFDAPWSDWRPGFTNHWSSGWETQQILKLAIAHHISSIGYFILDTQNFLISSWTCSVSGEKLPYNSGKFVMPLSTWETYSKCLGIDIGMPDDNTMAICTPIFLNTNLVNSLIDYFGGLYEFAKWFKTIPGKSEFILYLLWAEKNGGLERYHYKSKEWASPYLRDSNTFNQDFDSFFNFIGEHAPHVWVSANHRSWGDMSDDQYKQLCSKLRSYQLNPNFLDYRKNYLIKYR